MNKRDIFISVIRVSEDKGGDHPADLETVLLAFSATGTDGGVLGSTMFLEPGYEYKIKHADMQISARAENNLYLYIDSSGVKLCSTGVFSHNE